MPKKHRPLNRGSGAFRDASLIVIASEDRYAVKQYFERFRPRRVQFCVLPTEDSQSAPIHVMKRLDGFLDEYSVEDGDTFWVCIDVDRWQTESLSAVLRKCIKNEYGVAISNPCFELWILLHHRDVVRGSCQSPSAVTEILKEVLGGYSKQCCTQMQLTEPMIRQAIDRARSADTTDDMIPTAPTTRVYKILDAMIAREAISLDGASLTQ